jgi:hypothetical protein
MPVIKFPIEASVPDEQTAEAVIKALEAFAKAHPGCRFVFELPFPLDPEDRWEA